MQTGTGVNRTKIITIQALFTTNPQAILLTKQRHSTLENIYVIYYKFLLGGAQLHRHIVLRQLARHKPLA